MKPKNF